MKSTADFAGKRFARLVALRYDKTDGLYAHRWIFRCDCGVEKSITVRSVERGLTRSCGCLSAEAKVARPNRLSHGDARKGAVKRLHNIWRGMLKRCSPKVGSAEYAGRGIRVSKEWQKYSAFKAWAIANGYSDDMTIDRINNDGHYESNNCRWIPVAAQARNRRSSVIVDGKTLAEWAEQSVVAYPTLRYRVVEKHWPIHLAISTPAMTPSQCARRLYP